MLKRLTAVKGSLTEREEFHNLLCSKTAAQMMSKSDREIKAGQGSAQGFLHPSVMEGWQGSPLQNRRSGNHTPDAHKLFTPECSR